MSDGTYRCDMLDTYFSARGEVLEGIDAVIVGPAGYLNTVTVAYPAPEELDFPVTAENGVTYQVRIHLAEVWLTLEKNARQIFTVYDCSGRAPSAHLKVDH